MSHCLKKKRGNTRSRWRALNKGHRCRGERTPPRNQPSPSVSQLNSVNTESSYRVPHLETTTGKEKQMDCQTGSSASPVRAIVPHQKRSWK